MTRHAYKGPPPTDPKAFAGLRQRLKAKREQTLVRTFLADLDAYERRVMR